MADRRLPIADLLSARYTGNRMGEYPAQNPPEAMPSPAVQAFLARCGVLTDHRDLNVLARLWTDLHAAARRINLTAIDAEEDFWLLHVADSLAVGIAVPELLVAPGLHVADVGCGAGFPLLALAWANPALALVGLEPRLKRADFVRREVQRLGMPNCRVVDRQVSEVARDELHAGHYDAVVLRAVGSAAKFLRPCRRLLKPRTGAKVVFYKTPAAIAEELPAARREAAKLGLALRASDIIDLPADAGKRQFLLCEC
jgi:16S rRNA (guanine527-N7)-methyltransferase